MSSSNIAPTSRGSKYSDEDRRNAVTTLALVGNIRRAAEQLGMPHKTLEQWQRQPWWEELDGQLQAEHARRIQEQDRKIIDAAYSQLEDRINDGDYVLGREGEVYRKPMNGKDLAVVRAVSFDKYRLSQNKATSISEHSSGLAKIAEKLGQFSDVMERELNEKVVHTVDKPVDNTDNHT